MGARRIAIELAGEDVGSRVVVRPGRAWPIAALEQEPAMPFPFMIRLMRRRDSVTPSCPRACLIFLAPYTLPLSLHTRSTSFS